MGDQAFTDAMRLRLLIPTLQPLREDGHLYCSCQVHEVDIVHHPTHCLDCPRNQNTFKFRHDVICELLKNVIKANWLDAQVEREHPIGFVTGRGGFTADLHVEYGRERFAIDVSVTDPACASNLRYDADSKYGAGGAARADHKRRHYGPLQNVCVDHRVLDDDFQCPAGQIRLIPFVFEATGRPDVMVMKFLKLLDPENNDRRFIGRFLTSVSSCIAMYNSSMIRGLRQRVQFSQWTLHPDPSEV
ncbi:hypothetical protein B484DRAFT_405682 [Ochromonadaceae sp. CCMP2298]|nr:hypothetical protein B484DRAFT_405682 [Ochromonadaceae sp. CCMP2298]